MAEKRLVDMLRRKYPGMAKKVDYEKSRTSAIHLFCLECMGGCREEIRECRDFSCALWRYRPGAKDGELTPQGLIPSEKEYDKMIERRAGGADQLEASKKRGREMGKLGIGGRGSAQRSLPIVTEEDAEEVDPFEGI